MAQSRPSAGQRQGARRRVRAAGIVVVVLFLLWPIYNVLQVQVTAMRSPVARSAITACSQIVGWAQVYHVALMNHGAVCSALVHQDTFWSSISRQVEAAHWARFDCVVVAPGGAPFCSIHTLSGPGDWVRLTGPPSTDVTALVTSGAH